MANVATLNRDAERLLTALGGRFTFQTFDDSGRKDRTLSRVLYGALPVHADTLANLNARGAGVFVMANEGDGKGRSAGNVGRVRAYFADLDGAPLAPVHAAPLEAHIVIESSPERWHAYWLVEGAPIDSFKQVQRAIAERFASDPKVCDLPRVMRLPGFMHMKGQPFLSRIVEINETPRYKHAQFVEAFGIDVRAPLIARAGIRGRRATAVECLQSTARQKRALPAIIPEGERNNTLLSLAAGLVRDGYTGHALNQRLQRINGERSNPPLDDAEVDDIAERASTYGSAGFALLPHALLDSPEWKALAPAAHDVILMAFRRYNGSNNGNIALTWADFKGLPGFGDDATFYSHRMAALNSDVLRLAQVGKRSQQGRKPDLFAIAERFLPVSLTRNIRASANPKSQPSYIDKQLCVGSGGFEGSDPKRSVR